MFQSISKLSTPLVFLTTKNEIQIVERTATPNLFPPHFVVHVLAPKPRSITSAVVEHQECSALVGHQQLPAGIFRLSSWLRAWRGGYQSTIRKLQVATETAIHKQDEWLSP